MMNSKAMPKGPSKQPFKPCAGCKSKAKCKAAGKCLMKGK